jgi:hypothetical protein
VSKIFVTDSTIDGGNTGGAAIPECEDRNLERLPRGQNRTLALG